jgi:ribosomal protein S18 acetylase RimI-like enzyme
VVTIEKIDDTNKQRVIDSIKQDVVRHVFAFYDIQHDPEHTSVYAAFESGKLTGYILTYTATDVPSVILEGKSDAVSKLINFAPQNHFIIHAPPSLLPIIKRKFTSAKHYVEDWMLVRKDEANLTKSKLVRKLSTKEDASMLAELLATRKDRPERTLEKYSRWISTLPLYGVTLNGKLVSYAGCFIQLPQVWMIGGVYTKPTRRKRGYATLATSAITGEALRNAEAAALFVRSGNCPAISVYEKIGYKKIGEKVWVDVGTGLKP